MFISSETKAAIGQWQRSCSDFPCSIHFDFILSRSPDMIELDVIVKHRCPGSNKVKFFQNQSPTCSPRPPRHVMVVKCDQPLDELTVYMI